MSLVQLKNWACTYTNIKQFWLAVWFHLFFPSNLFSEELFETCCVSAVKSHNPLVKQLKLQTNHEDFELRKLLMNVLVLLSRDPTVIAVSLNLSLSSFGFTTHLSPFKEFLFSNKMYIFLLKCVSVWNSQQNSKTCIDWDPPSSGNFILKISMNDYDMWCIPMY